MKKAVLIPNLQKDPDLDLTKRIIDTLRSAGASVVMSNGLLDKRLNGVEYVDDRALFDSADFAVTVGGDGTILRAAEESAEHNVPVIGVNLGRIGFLAEIEPDEIDLLVDVVNGDYYVEKRMMLDVAVVRNGKKTNSYIALNDVVVSKGNISKIAELELYCNSTLVSLFHSDGLIVCTPTGSTAYSLSAGGAIIDPTIDCMLLTPVCSHSFSNSRSIVFSPKSVLEIKDIQKGEDNTYLTVDGKINEKLTYSDVVQIRASDKTTNLIKIKNKEFYDRVYQKIAERK